MGSGSSKPEASAGSKHVFSSNTPVQFSSNLVEALQSNSETDSSRARTLELQIQERVAQELERLRAREQKTLTDIEQRLAEVKDTAETAAATSPSPTTTTTTTTSTNDIDHTPGSLDLDAPRIPFAGRDHTQSAPQDHPVNRSITHASVNSEIEKLRNKLDARKKLSELDEGVARAKADVVGCLRVNDRRPLDCYKEVEGFKREVARLEAAFVDRVVG